MANPNPNPSTRFKPGAEWRGNPNGRPKGRSFTARLREMVERDAADGTRQLADIIVARLIKIALKGSDSDARQAIKDMWERIDGKVPDRLAGPEGEPLKIIVKWEDESPE